VGFGVSVRAKGAPDRIGRHGRQVGVLGTVADAITNGGAVIRAGLMATVCVLTICAVASAGVRAPVIYAPVATNRAACVWLGGRAIASFELDSTAVWLILDSDVIASTTYIRLWCMSLNRSQRTYLIEPRAAFAVTVQDPKTRADVCMQPESPQFILTRISSEKTAAFIMTAIGGALRAVSAGMTEPTRVTGTGAMAGSGYVVNDAQEKAEVRMDRAVNRTTAEWAGTANWYDTFAGSVNEVVLRKNTMFPGKSVNGYVYFPRFKDITEPAPGRLSATRSEQARYYQGVDRVLKAIGRCDIEVTVTLPTDTLMVLFRPVSAE
jgi:hypothetical protein